MVHCVLSSHFSCVHAKSPQSCPTLQSLWTIAHQAPLSMIYQARILGWVAMSSSRGSSQLSIGPKSLKSLALAVRFFYHTSSTWSHCPVLHSDPQPRFCRGRGGVIQWDSYLHWSLQGVTGSSPYLQGTEEKSTEIYKGTDAPSLKKNALYVLLSGVSFVRSAELAFPALPSYWLPFNIVK